MVLGLLIDAGPHAYPTPDHYNTKCASADGMKFFYNDEAWMGTMMIVMGCSLVARAQKVQMFDTRHALILNFNSGAKNWTFANLHLPTSWASVAGFEAAVWKIHETLERTQEQMGRGMNIITAGDLKRDILEDHRDEKAQWLANWLVSWGIKLDDRNMPERETTVRRGATNSRRIDYILGRSSARSHHGEERRGHHIFEEGAGEAPWLHARPVGRSRIGEAMGRHGLRQSGGRPSRGRLSRVRARGETCAVTRASE